MSSSENDFCVISLGKFGISVVRTLEDLGKVTLAIDKREECCQLVSSIASETLILDSTNRGALEDAGIHKIQNIIIAVGSDLAASIVTAVHVLAIHRENNTLNRLNLVAKAVDSTHQLILEAIGITNIILSETEAGKKAAYRAIWKLGVDLTTVDDKYSIASVIVKNMRFTNKKLETLRIPTNYKINLVAIKRAGKVIIPSRNEILMLNDELLFISSNDNINNVYNDFSINNSTKVPERLVTKVQEKKLPFWKRWGKKRKKDLVKVMVLILKKCLVLNLKLKK
ncbi:TrkA family potassium uptake protein [Spiroplasma sp. AdecLV25b]|uniref:potassium channel family protein n=1 Tax=Spiroplasma sp. AdecLV25b TaxID=3027162 RepID=UPI0027E06365|nr:TrkA family potassium uptake protein [Spiroplasma sp. AdecLV25b]